MFEFLFKYPAAVFSKGNFVLLGTWPLWLLFGGIIAAAAGLGWLIWRGRKTHAGDLRGFRPASVWLLQTVLVALIFLMIWRPALSIATLKPQQNIVAVVVDDSRSMALREDGSSRHDQAIQTLNAGLLTALQKKFQVRLYRMGGNLERIAKLDQLNVSAPATRIGEDLKQVVAESSNLPIGAVVLLSDGADNSGGIDLDTISEIRRQHIPVHTIGFGREQFAHDIEINDATMPARALANARLSADVTFHQRGYSGRKARLTLREGGKTLASEEVILAADGKLQTESLLFSAGPTGAKNFVIAIDPLDGEENVNNNQVTRVVNVDASKPRILYIEGEPRWEFKFIRRAVEDDKSLDLVTMLRTTQNKIYRQGVKSPEELAEGFPTKVEEIFGFQGIIIGSLTADYLTPTQQELIKQFVDRRGGGVLFLGGRESLGDGGYGKEPFADLLPVTLPARKPSFFREPAYAELTPAGRNSLLCRIEENPDRNVQRWAKLPYMMNYQDPGQPKPGAVVLANSILENKARLPLLITQNYGRGRTAVFATAGSWRWQMLQPLNDMSHETFWRQMMRWMVSETHEHVVASTPKPVLADDTRLHLRAEVRDHSYLPATDARVEAHIIGPDGLNATADLHPDPLEAGIYVGEWGADKAGSYVVEVSAKRDKEEVGRDVFTFRREDGVAENFHAEQNRELLEKLATETGGRYYKARDAQKLGDDVSYSEAGITVRETKDLWDMPLLFLLALLLRGSEWFLRRRWGVI